MSDELPANVRALIERAQRAPVQADRAAIRAKIDATLSAGSTPTGGGSGGAGKLLLHTVVTVVATVGGGYWLAHRSSPATSVATAPGAIVAHAVASAPAPRPTAPPAGAPVVHEQAASREPTSLPSKRTTARAPAPTAARVTAREPVASASPTLAAVAPPVLAAAAPPMPAPARGAAPMLDDEARLLADTTRASTRGDANRVLALVAEHTRRFPDGALVEERDALELDALLALGRRDEATAAARRFASRHPHSVHAPLVERALTTKETPP